MGAELLTSWDESTAEELCHGLMAGGWGRQFPSLGGILLMSIAIQLKPSTLDELTRVLGHPVDREADWESACWEPYEPYTAESFEEIKAQYGDDDDRDVETANAEELAHHQAHMAQVDGYAAHFGLGPVRTCRELLALLVATGIVGWTDNGRLAPAYPLRDVEDVLPVSDEERAVLAQMRLYDDQDDSDSGAE